MNSLVFRLYTILLLSMLFSRKRTCNGTRAIEIVQIQHPQELQGIFPALNYLEILFSLILTALLRPPMGTYLFSEVIEGAQKRGDQKRGADPIFLILVPMNCTVSVTRYADDYDYDDIGS